MTDAIILGLRQELAGWGPELFFGGLRLVLNDKVRVWIGVQNQDLIIELAQTRVRHTNSNWELLWLCPLTDPACFDKLVAFLRHLPDSLAKIDPARWAIDP